jgi:16S rRNA (adenine1518-N6/adenine1519-N6)-dimethyltransferase
MLKKKSLGQHFLKSAAHLRAIVDAAEVTKGDIVLEIGPGEGALTKELLERGATVVAVEKDRRLIPWLEMTFDKELREKQLVLHEADALEISAETIFGNKKQGGYKLVANIPYYITGALLKKFLSEESNQPSTLVFLVQKEVAERIAKSKKESILSLSVKAYGEVKYVKTVPRGAFAPAPDVDSAILLVKDVSKKNFADEKAEKRFFDLVRAGFSQKRKKLKNNLSGVLGAEMSVRMEKAGISENARAEDIPLEKWLLLAQ